MYQLTAINQKKGGQVILHDINLQIPEHKILAILGPSGSGKTTLLNILAQIDTPTGGTIIDADGRRPKGVMVFQDYRLFPHLTVLRNITFGLKVRHVNKASRLQQADAIMAIVGISDLAQRYPDELSGGQQQRVALARALILKPDLLLMDEPFSSLDESLRLEMLDFIKQLQQQLALTIVFVTHYKSEAYLLSNQVAILINGQIMQLATPQQLEQRPANLAVARFLGQANFINGQWQAGHLTTDLYSGSANFNGPNEQRTVVLYLPFSGALQLQPTSYPAFKGQVVALTWAGAYEQVTVQSAATQIKLNLPVATVQLQQTYQFYFTTIPVVF
ncbi:ABC transporter ATP-binding protein [Loigolactobacillus jiayinensis]|uniref:ABC transporter ATP-binding protein n=1 Tax=Loigolactobacillus jiayinensis TaxID=2486016 RepID=A0ABW1RF34_9LACO|nr:ABC transporter ATP-binding protein [Loigolactobacillus jiayinensis]